MTLRRCSVEQVFGTLKHWMGATHFLTKTLPHVSTESSLNVLAYNSRQSNLDHPPGRHSTIHSVDSQAGK
jgi:hypothetical protein